MFLLIPIIQIRSGSRNAETRQLLLFVSLGSTQVLSETEAKNFLLLVMHEPVLFLSLEMTAGPSQEQHDV